MAAFQSAYLALIHCHREQAPSHRIRYSLLNYRQL